jgi:hypothetical protein
MCSRGLRRFQNFRIFTMPTIAAVRCAATLSELELNEFMEFTVWKP